MNQSLVVETGVPEVIRSSKAPNCDPVSRREQIPSGKIVHVRQTMGVEFRPLAEYFPPVAQKEDGVGLKRTGFSVKVSLLPLSSSGSTTRKRCLQLRNHCICDETISAVVQDFKGR